MIRQHGFTLVELMIVVVVIGILTVVAVPGYNNFRVKSSRAAAQTELLQLASLQEKIYLNSSAYSPNLAAAYTGQNSGGLGKTGSVTADGKYNLAFNGTPAQTFEIRATPVAGSTQVNDGCLLIMHNGVRQWHEGVDNCTSGSPKSW